MVNMDSELTPFDPDLEDDLGRGYPWGPQSGETSLGFGYFCQYRDLGPQRSIAALARELGRDSSTLRAMSAKFAWPDRAFAFDAWLDKRSLEDLARGRTQMREEHAEVAILARQKLTARLRTLNPDEMSVRDVATFLELSIKLERQARGEADKVVQVQGEVSIVEGLGSAERRALMVEAMRVLAERTGTDLSQLEGVVDAEVVEDAGEATAL